MGLGQWEEKNGEAIQEDVVISTWPWQVTIAQRLLGTF